MPWKIHKEKKAKWWRKYYLKASLEQNGNLYELIAGWDQPINAINIYKNKDYNIETCLLNMVLWADADIERIVHKVLKITSLNVEKGIRRVEVVYDKSVEKPLS